MTLNELKPLQRAIVEDCSLGHSEAAKKLGWKRAKLESLRRRSGITITSNLGNIQWTQDMDDVVKSSTIAEAVKTLAVSHTAVELRRKKLAVKRPKYLQTCPHCGKKL